MNNLVQVGSSIALTVGITTAIMLLLGFIAYKKLVPYLMQQTLKGFMSGFSRNQKAVKKKIVKIMMDKTLIGPILDGLGLGELKSYAIKHPDATMTIIQYLGPYLSEMLGESEGLPALPNLMSGGAQPTTEVAETISERVKRLSDRIHLRS